MNILVNKAKCKKCGDIITSRHRHDFVRCKCGSISTDGGNDYLHRSWRDGHMEDLIEDLSIYDYDSFDKIRSNMFRFNTKMKKYVYLKDIDDEWLENILEYYIPPDNEGNMADHFLLQYLKEKQYRWNIEI